MGRNPQQFNCFIGYKDRIMDALDKFTFDNLLAIEAIDRDI